METSKQCPIHDGDVRCLNRANTLCMVGGHPGQGSQLESFEAAICVEHYRILTEYRTGTSMPRKVPDTDTVLN